MKKIRNKFWVIPLAKMNSAEWEEVCDRCGKCCVVKLTTETNPEIYYTSIPCKLFDISNCSCKDYNTRTKLVDGCIKLTPENIKDSIKWMPDSCAYKLLYKGKPLPSWHHLVSACANSIHLEGESMRNKTISEAEVPKKDWENFITKKIV